MKKRYRQQQTVESDRAPYQEARYSQQARAPRETGSIRWTMVLCVSILGLLIIATVILGIMSLADVIHGHPGMTWQHFTAWLQSNLWWLIGGPLVALVVFKVVLPVHETRAYTAVERAEARRINEETRRLREIRYHNEEHMPQAYIPLSDELGNYPQLVYPDRSVTYLFPANAPTGNAGINPKHLMDFMERMNTVDEDDYEEEEEEEEPERIALPEVSIHLTDDCRIPANDLLSGRKLFVGLSGSGKSNTVGAYCEELGRLEAPLVLADTENEYQPLCDPRWFPRGELADARTVTLADAYQFGQGILSGLKQVILNLQSYEMEEAALIMINIIQGMRDWQEEQDLRIPSEFILEEAVTWLPQNIKESPLYRMETFNLLQGTFFNDMVRKGRKRGLGITIVCQKVAEIDKRALQANGRILHYQSEPPDLATYARMGIPREETLSLQTGDAFLSTLHMSNKRIHVRRRYSEHGADTPGLENLQRYQRTRNLPENASGIRRNSGEIPGEQAGNSENFDRPVEPFQNISDFRRAENGAASDPLKGVPEMLRKEIEDAYERRGRKNRTEIRDELQLNGDQYWMVKAVCNEYDKKMRGGA